MSKSVKSNIGALGAVGSNTKNKINSLASSANEYVPPFLKTDSLVGKFVFLIFVLILFIYALKIITKLIAYLFIPSTSPYIVKGMRRGNKGMQISQDPAKKDSITILRSNDENAGMEFTWSVWLFIDKLPEILETGEDVENHIFSKGAQNTTTQSLRLNGPGLYITEKGELKIKMDIFSASADDTTSEEIIIENIPTKKWKFIVIRLKGKTLDVYINGKIARRHILQYPAKQNYGDIFVTQENGFTGALSNLRYFDHALDVQTINDMSDEGPNLTVYSDDELKNTSPPYFSVKWYIDH